MTMLTIVSFRVFKPSASDPGGQVIAIFPCFRGARRGLCGGYWGGSFHDDVDPISLTHLRTRIAERSEYEALQNELESEGYKLRIVRRLRQQYYWWFGLP